MAKVLKTETPSVSLEDVIKQQAEQIARLETMIRKVGDIDRVNKFDKSENVERKSTCRLSYFRDELIIGLEIVGWRPMAGQSGMKEHQYKVTTRLDDGKVKTYEVYLGEYMEWSTDKPLKDNEVTFHTIESKRPGYLTVNYHGELIEVSDKVINM